MKEYLTKEFFLKNKGIIIKATAIVLIIAVAFVVFAMKDKGDEEQVYLEQTESEATEAQESETTGEKIIVDVSGAVNTPSVVELPEESRIQDAIEAAGGLKDNADLSNINRAAFISDGEKVVIPVISKGNTQGSTEDISQETASGNTENRAGNGLVNINSATSEQLQTLTGIGPALASRIIDYREENGRFQKKEEIKEVKGIGEKTFEKFKDKIAI